MAKRNKILLQKIFLELLHNKEPFSENQTENFLRNVYQLNKHLTCPKIFDPINFNLVLIVGDNTIDRNTFYHFFNYLD